MSDRELVITGSLEEIQKAGVALIERIKGIWPNGVMGRSFPALLLYRDAEAAKQWQENLGKYPEDPSSSVVVLARKLVPEHMEMVVTLDSSDHPDVVAITGFVKELGLPFTTVEVSDEEAQPEIEDALNKLNLLKQALGQKVGKA